MLCRRVRKLACAAVLVYALIVAGGAAQAQTFQVIHSFATGAPGGTEPYAGLTLDPAGNLYGTTTAGGFGGSGTVFRLSHQGSGWILSVLHSFTGGSDGGEPNAGLIFDQAGNLYGTTTEGGDLNCGGLLRIGCGTVFELQRPPTPCTSEPCPWRETVLHAFTEGDDGGFPENGDLVFDQAGNLYGTTQAGGLVSGGNSGYGTVFKLSPSGSGWTESVLYKFTGGSDGGTPDAGLIFDQTGNLYGTTTQGGAPDCAPLSGCGTVFKLSPSGSGWTESVLYSFTAGTDGWSPIAGLVFDQSGRLYGAAAFGGENLGGTVFQLTPSNGSWTLETIHSFTGEFGPHDSLVIDGEGNLYGATPSDNYEHDAGSVFELIPNSNGGWNYSLLHEFLCGRFCLDGGAPFGRPIFDTNGNIYGTTEFDGPIGHSSGLTNGVVWEITP